MEVCLLHKRKLQGIEFCYSTNTHTQLSIYSHIKADYLGYVWIRAIKMRWNKSLLFATLQKSFASHAQVCGAVSVSVCECECVSFAQIRCYLSYTISNIRNGEYKRWEYGFQFWKLPDLIQLCSSPVPFIRIALSLSNTVRVSFQFPSSSSPHVLLSLLLWLSLSSGCVQTKIFIIL